MDGCYSTGMTGVPGLEHIDCSAVANLSDNDPVGSEPQGIHDRLLIGINGRLNEDFDLVLGVALEFGVVLDDVDSVVGIGHLLQEGIDEGRFSRSCAPGNENVLFVTHGLPKKFSVFMRKDLPIHIVLKWKNNFRRFSEGECRG